MFRRICRLVLCGALLVHFLTDNNARSILGRPTKITRRRPLLFFAHSLVFRNWVARRPRATFSRRYNLAAVTGGGEDSPRIPSGTTNINGALLRSRISKIRARNLAGVVGVNDDEEVENSDIIIPFESEQSYLVAITGETGHGKSLLVARTVELLTGGKAAPTYLSALHETAIVEVELLLREPLLSAVNEALSEAGLDPFVLEAADPDDASSRKLVLSRELLFQPAASSPHGNNNDKPRRMKSTCQINGQNVTLKVLSSLASPLLTLVDAATAATALSKPESRLAILDTAVPATILDCVRQTRKTYRHRRRERERLEQELAARTLPLSFTSMENEDDLQLLSHWIGELDAFENRVTEFCCNMVSDSGTGDSELEMLCQKLAATSWDHLSKQGVGSSSTMFLLLSDFRDSLQALDAQYAAATNAVDSLASLSSPTSAATALEKARNFLFDASTSRADDSHLTPAAERAHDLLNEVETALQTCRRFIEDDDRGLIRSLEMARAVCPVSVESVDEILLEWKSLARKHGIHPSTLPSCHRALESERNGNAEARIVLPKAIEEEAEALAEFEIACSDLSTERQMAAKALTECVSIRLPSLGMESSNFRVDLQSDARTCSEPSAYSSNAILGVDSVDFVLVHGASTRNRKQGNVHEIASSGEKARILLAIECGLPGSVGAACSSANSASSDYWNGIAPVAVVYDEIDSHVGGRAAVAMATMLRDQSESSQVVAITHSPSVAAAADMHVVIQKIVSEGKFPDGSTPVKVTVVNDAERRKELARMASGDIALDEAEIFADALIREGARRRDSSYVNQSKTTY